MYVNNYSNYLTNLGVVISDTRLITKDELLNLGCSTNTYCCYPYEWIFSSAYWTMTPYDDNELWVIHGDADFNFTFESYSEKYFYGVRPVITISKSNFQIN